MDWLKVKKEGKGKNIKVVKSKLSRLQFCRVGTIPSGIGEFPPRTNYSI